MEGPAMLDPTETIRRMGQFEWYHTLELGRGLVTKGHYDHRPILRHYGLPASLAGKTVLDVGPAHGFFAFEFERRGAARVVTVELPRWSAHDGSPELKSSFHRNQADVRYRRYLHAAL